MKSVVHEQNRTQTHRFIGPIRGRQVRDDAQFSVGVSLRSWDLIRAAISQIYLRNANSLSFEELYRAAYTLVLNKHGMRLYAGIQDLVASHLSSSASKLLVIDDQAEFMRTFLHQWEHHRMVLRLICDIVMYMDHNFVRSHNKAPTKDMGMRLFQTHMLLSPSGVGERFIQALLELIDDSRCPDTSLVDSSSIPQLVSILIETSLGKDCEDVYEQLFLGGFLDRTEQYYSKKALTISALSHLEYVDTALAAYDAEATLVSRGFDTKYTFPKLVERLNKTWIIPYYKSMISFTLENPDNIFLGKMYRLFSRTAESRQFLIEAFVDQCRTLLKSALEIPEMIEQRKKVFTLIRNCFQQDADVLFQTKQTFECVLNDSGGERISKLLSKYLDDLIRRKNESVEDQSRIDECLELFKFVQSKDLFEGYYKYYLGRRLLGQGLGIPDLEGERIVLSKLKAECGSGFTSKMEGMVADVHNSHELMMDWGLEKQMHVRVLTTGLWPSKQSSATIVRFDGMDEFETFYGKKFSGRKLTWVHSLGNMEMRARFESGVYTLILSAIQGMILMEMERLGTSIRFTNLPKFCEETELKRHFISLVVSPRCRLVVPVSDGGIVPKSLGEFDVNQEWKVDEKFSSSSRVVKMPLIVAKDTVASEQKEDPADTGIGSSVEEDRKHLLEASLIRVMKGRKSLEHNNLVAEVVALMSNRFVPSVDAIKARIENLIEREFIRRDEADPKVYHYVA